MSEIVLALLLAVPLVTLAIPSFGYWSNFKTAKQSSRPVKKTTYPRIYFYLLVGGVMCMWVCWIGGIVLLISGEIYCVICRVNFSQFLVLSPNFYLHNSLDFL